MTVVVTPVNTMTLAVGSDQVECQVISHNLSDAEQAGGETWITACGDTVTIPADDTNLGTLDLTYIPDREDLSFYQWTWAHAGETATFTLVTNPGQTGSLEWSGELTVQAIPEKQDVYRKKETADVSFTITAWMSRAVVPTP